MLNWNSEAKRYVEGNDIAAETFGLLDNYLTPSHDWISRHNAEEDSCSPLVSLAPANDNRPGYIYLGSPYSKYELGHEAAAAVVSACAAVLMGRGMKIYCPIAHGHFISKHGNLPQTWGFWREQCDPMIDGAESLIVLMMDGWGESIGLQYEIERFAGRRVDYMKPADLLSEWGMAA